VYAASQQARGAARNYLKSGPCGAATQPAQVRETKGEFRVLTRGMSAKALEIALSAIVPGLFAMTFLSLVLDNTMKSLVYSMKQARHGCQARALCVRFDTLPWRNCGLEPPGQAQSVGIKKNRPRSQVTQQLWDRIQEPNRTGAVLLPYQSRCRPQRPA
jgi:hypothetical protein